VDVRRALWLTLLLPACLFPDLSSISGASDGAPFDAANDSTPSDAANDTAVSDGSTGDGAGWCASQDAGYRFCTDFDESMSAVQGFDLETTVGQGGQFNVTTTQLVSPPHGALGVASPFSPGQTSGDRLIKSLWALGTTPATFTCTFQWNPVALSTTANDYAHVAAFELYSDEAATQQIANYSINLNGNGLLELLEISNNNAVSHPITTGGVATGSWLSVTLSILPGQNYSVTVGTKGATGILSYPVATTSHGTVEIGPAYFAGTTTSPSPGWTFGYDNVICQ
jgi:hypothetical protein